MQKAKNPNYLYFFIGISGIIFAISPWWTTDGFNVPKFVVLVIFSSIILLQLDYKNLLSLITANKKLILVFLFPLNMLLVVIFSEANKFLQIYGDFGKRTGLLTYLACLVLFLYCTQLRLKDARRSFAMTMIILGAISAIYSILQPLGFFKINDLASKNMTPYSFFGNTNFSSAFAGFASVFLIPFFKKNIAKNLIYNFKYLLILLIIIYSIYKTNSQQGFIICFIGYFLFFLIRVIKGNASIFLKLSFLMFVILSSIIFMQGIFGKGIASKFIYQESVLARNFYWKAGWEMALSKPFFGLGLDRYGDWYWAYRDLEAINKFGPENNTRSAHNIFLDLASSGGFILLSSYLIFLGLILFSAIRIIGLNKDFDDTYVVMFSAWIAFGFFSFISIGQIGILILNWILAGFLIAPTLLTKRNFENSNLTFKFGFSRFLIGLVLGLIIVFPTAKESVWSKHAISQNTPLSLTNYLENNNTEPRNISIIADKLNYLGGDSIQYVRQSLKEFPNDYNLWYLLITSKNSTTIEKNLAYTNILRLNKYLNMNIVDAPLE